jgi:16S rRNA processing protein RimM
MADRVCVGAIAGAFGVRGEVRLKSFCAVPEDIAAYGPLEPRGRQPQLHGEAHRARQGRLRGAAWRRRHEGGRRRPARQRLYAPRDALPNLPDDEFYHADLIGLEVCDTGGKPLGRISAVLNHGASDLLEIRAPGKRTPRSSPSRPRSCPPST